MAANKKRVHELAKELKITSKEFIKYAQDLGYKDVRSHANSLESEKAEEIKQKVKEKLDQQKKQKSRPNVIRRRKKVVEEGGEKKLEVTETKISASGEKKLLKKEVTEASIEELLGLQPPEPIKAKESPAEDSKPVEKTPPAEIKEPSPTDESSQPSPQTADREPQQVAEKAEPSSEPPSSEQSQPPVAPTQTTGKKIDGEPSESPNTATQPAASPESTVPSQIDETEAALTSSNDTEQPTDKELPSASQPAAEASAPPSPSERTDSELEKPVSTDAADSIPATQSATEISPPTEPQDSGPELASPPSETASPPVLESSPQTAGESLPEREEKTHYTEIKEPSPKREVSPEQSSPPRATELPATKHTSHQAVQTAQTRQLKEASSPALQLKESPPSIGKTKDRGALREEKAAMDIPGTAEVKRNLEKTIPKVGEPSAPKKKDKYRQLEREFQQTSGKGKKGFKQERQKKKRRVHHQNIDVSFFGDEDWDEQELRHAKKPAKKKKDREKKKQPVTAPPSEKKRIIKIDGTISVGDLAHRMGKKAQEIIKFLLLEGVVVNINQNIDAELAQKVAKKYGYEVQDVGFSEEKVINADEQADDPALLEPRPPIVTMMGHVDHGKTSLLDAIRKTRVAAREAGGITQHIGASVVELPEKGKIVFLDTPGHEAFSAMRARGAQVTDIVVLVVAADDGVMPQTIEAISHAKAAGVPIVVAINKIDKPDADPLRVKTELMKHDIIPEEFGGDVLTVNVSAHTKEGIDELLENILLQAELMELKANPHKRAKGIVIESKVEKGRGPIANVIVKEGTLKKGDIIVADVYYGRVRAMFGENNKPLQEAGPSMPAQILGLSGPPSPGTQFHAVENEKLAKQLVEYRLEKKRQKELQGPQRRTHLEDLWSNEEKKELNLILKTDVEGTLEAIKGSLQKLDSKEVKLNVVHAGVGGITEGDVNLAASTDSVIFGFNVRADSKAQKLAESVGVEIRTYRVIYELLDDIKAAMERKLAPTIQEKPIGQAEIRRVFKISKVGNVAGCYVTEGKITRNSLIRLYRDNIKIYEGKIASLRRFKEDVREVAAGYECGIQIEGFQDIKENDIIEAYELEEVSAKLDI